MLTVQDKSFRKVESKLSLLTANNMSSGRMYEQNFIPGNDPEIIRVFWGSILLIEASHKIFIISLQKITMGTFTIKFDLGIISGGLSTLIVGVSTWNQARECEPFVWNFWLLI